MPWWCIREHRYDLACSYYLRVKTKPNIVLYATTGRRGWDYAIGVRIRDRFRVGTCVRVRVEFRVAASA